jgi:hypothetical protein
MMAGMASDVTLFLGCFHGLDLLSVVACCCHRMKNENWNHQSLQVLASKFPLVSKTNKYVVLILEIPSIKYNTAGVALVLTRKSNRMGLKKRRATLLERQAFGKALLA